MLVQKNRNEELTGFQEASQYSESIDLQTDFVMVYGIGSDLEERIGIWRSKGYNVHLMTGVSWGQYQNYLNGKVDGRKHWDEGQVNEEGKGINHNPTVPYMVPTIAYTEFLTENIKRAIDCGVDSIHLEEPEFWGEGGYADAFKREWEIFYKEHWQDPALSVDAQYKASKLKHYLYTRCLDRMSSSIKEYAKVKYDRQVRFFVPTHSLVNYTHWRIVSPESRLLDLPTIDGYIAQIWTGTSRTPNMYKGVMKERSLENAFLEYGMMEELIRGTDREMWFLHDPIEDNPRYTWGNYEMCYDSILIASLLHPGVHKYEICPWPNRVFNGTYPKNDGMGKEGIPAHYATKLLTLMNTLRDMNQSETIWETDNSEVGVLLADSGMFQRKYPGDQKEAERRWMGFYGLTMPLLKEGVYVKPVQLDNIRRVNHYLDRYHTLILSYEFMKPQYPEIHTSIAQWVRNGGTLIYVGDGSDAFHEVTEWWNTGNSNYDNPMEHLLECCEIIKEDGKAIYEVGKGVVAILDSDPSQLTINETLEENFKHLILKATNVTQHTIKYEKGFLLRRGPYVIGTKFDEMRQKESLSIEGRFINLLDAHLPVQKDLCLEEGDLTLLYDLDKVNDTRLIAASSRVDKFESDEKEIKITLKGPKNVKGIACIYCKSPIFEVKAINEETKEEVAMNFVYDEVNKLGYFHYDNIPQGVMLIVILDYKR